MKILNRIIVFILGIGVLPVMFFNALARALVSIAQDSSIYTILKKIASDNEFVDSAMEIKVSIKDLLSYISEGKFSIAGMDFDINKIPVEMLSKKNWLIATGVLLVIALLIALVIAGCALFTKAYKTMICLGAGGTICTFAAIQCFSKFATPFLDGTVDLGSLLGKAVMGNSESILGSLGTAFLEGAINIDAFQLGSGVFTMMIMFIGVMLWEIAYYVTLPEDQKPQKKVKA